MSNILYIFFIFSGGVLFFIVAIIVSVCTVKICNRRKRRKQEQGKQINKQTNKQHKKQVKKKLKERLPTKWGDFTKRCFIGIFLFIYILGGRKNGKLTVRLIYYIQNCKIQKRDTACAKLWVFWFNPLPAIFCSSCVLCIPMYT